jgi:hypothetical protein
MARAGGGGNGFVRFFLLSRSVTSGGRGGRAERLGTEWRAVAARVDGLWGYLADGAMIISLLSEGLIWPKKCACPLYPLYPLPPKADGFSPVLPRPVLPRFTRVRFTRVLPVVTPLTRFHWRLPPRAVQDSGKRPANASSSS